jgi:hypothetical protein
MSHKRHYKSSKIFVKTTLFFAENKTMKIEGLTIAEMASILNLPYKTVQKRLERSGIEPITTGTIYPASALETIRNIRMGRPPKAKPEDPDQAAKPAKTTKK